MVWEPLGSKSKLCDRKPMVWEPCPSKIHILCKNNYDSGASGFKQQLRKKTNGLGALGFNKASVVQDNHWFWSLGAQQIKFCASTLLVWEPCASKICVSYKKTNVFEAQSFKHVSFMQENQSR